MISTVNPKAIASKAMLSRDTKRSFARGFSLAETLIAVVILTMMGMLTYGALARATRARERSENIALHYHQIRQALERMARELSSAFLSAHRYCDEPRSQTLFQTRPNGSQGDRLNFTSFSHVKIGADVNESDQNELGYFVDEDPDASEKTESKWALMRREAVRIDDEPDKGGEVSVLARGVRKLSFEFYDDKSDQWEDDWDTESFDQRDRLPMFVSIVLESEDAGGEKEMFTTKTRIWLQESLLISPPSTVRCSR